MPQGISAVRPTNGLYLYLLPLFCLCVRYSVRSSNEEEQKIAKMEAMLETVL